MKFNKKTKIENVEIELLTAMHVLYSNIAQDEYVVDMIKRIEDRLNYLKEKNRQLLFNQINRKDTD